MTKKANYGFDMAKFMGEFEPGKMMSELSKNLEKYKIPGFDMSAVIDAQRKNLDALADANKATMEGVQAVAKRQAEILQQTVDEVTAAVGDMATADSPQANAAKQAELVKTTLEKAMVNARELAEMAAKSNAEALEAINTRFSEAMDDIKKLAEKIKT